MGAAWWGGFEPDAITLIRKDFFRTFQVWPFSVRWRDANRYDVQMFPYYTDPKDQRHYTYLIIAGRAVRQN